MLFTAKSFLRDKYPIVTILILATFLRFYEIDAILLNHDSGRAIFESLEMIEEGELFRNISISYVSVPFFNFLLLVPLLVYKNLYSMVVFFTLLNIASVFICYKIGKDFFNEKVGIISSCLFSVSPFSVLFLRGTLFNSYILPLFVSLFFYFLLSFALKQKTSSFIPACIFLFLSTQIHPSAYGFIPVVVIFMFVRGLSLRKIHILLALLIISICFFFAREKFAPSNFWSNWSIVDFPGQEGESVIYLILISYVTLLKEVIISVVELFSFPLGDYFQVTNEVPSVFRRLFISVARLEVMIFILGSAGVFYRAAFHKGETSKREAALYGILSIWILYLFLVPFEIMYDRFFCNVEDSSLFNPEFFDSEFYSNVQLRYLIPIFPLPFLIIGAACFRMKTILYKRIQKGSSPAVFNKWVKIILILIISSYAAMKIMACGKIVSHEDFSKFTVKSKNRVIDSLINDFEINDYETYRQKVSFVGMSNFFDSGYNILFYLKKGFRKMGAEVLRDANNVLIIKQDPMQYPESVMKKVDIKRSKDFGQMRLVEYGFPYEDKCKDRCLLERRKIEYGKNSFAQIQAEMDMESDSLCIIISTSADILRPDHICLTYGNESSATEYFSFPEQGELKIDMRQRVPFFKEGVNLLQIRATGDLYSKSLMYVMFRLVKTEEGFDAILP